MLRYSKVTLKTAEGIRDFQSLKLATITDIVSVVTSTQNKDVATVGIKGLSSGINRAYTEREKGTILKAADAIGAIGLASDQNKLIATQALDSVLYSIDNDKGVDAYTPSQSKTALGSEGIEHLRALRSVIITEKSGQ